MAGILSRKSLAGVVLIAALGVLAMHTGASAQVPTVSAAAGGQAAAQADDPCPGQHRRDHGRRRGDDGGGDNGDCQNGGGSGGGGNGNGYTPPPPPPPPYQPVYGPPGTPYGLQPSSVQPYSITFSWSPGAGTTSGYWVYAPYPSPTEQIDSGTSFTVSGVTPGGYYCLTVLAYNAVGFSSWSSWSCVSAPQTVMYAPVSSGCPTGYVLGPGGCMPPPIPTSCPNGTMPSQGGCVPTTSSGCPYGYIWVPSAGVCVP